MFGVNERVVYPGYGVALIYRKVNRKIAGRDTYFFELKFSQKDMTVLIPENRLESVGIRPLSSQKDIKKLLDMLDCKPERHTSETVNWNKRNKDYQCKLRSGDIFQICKMYKDLQDLRFWKELSFGERGLLVQIENLLAEEVSAVLKLDVEKARDFLRKPFDKFDHLHSLENQASMKQA